MSCSARLELLVAAIAIAVSLVAPRVADA